MPKNKKAGKLRYAHTVEHYSALKNELLTRRSTWMKVKNNANCKKKGHMTAFRWDFKKDQSRENSDIWMWRWEDG
jgi:hypothetical protein